MTQMTLFSRPPYVAHSETSKAAAVDIEPKQHRLDYSSLAVGAKCGRLTLLSKERRTQGDGWRCRCECGKQHWTEAYLLLRGLCKSCGCLKRESLCPRKLIHGQKRTKTYRTWSRMKERCLRPNHKSYGDYGGRGITVCERWLTFANFFEDMGHAPNGLQLDRRDNSGNYEPSNCRWVDTRTQQRNTRANRILTAFGESKTMIEWTEDMRCGVTKDTLWHRLDEGWPTEEAITRPLRYQFYRHGRTKAGKRAAIWEAIP